jgi:hypothetical protein
MRKGFVMNARKRERDLDRHRAILFVLAAVTVLLLLNASVTLAQCDPPCPRETPICTSITGMGDVCVECTSPADCLGDGTNFTCPDFSCVPIPKPACPAEGCPTNTICVDIPEAIGGGRECVCDCPQNTTCVSSGDGVQCEAACTTDEECIAAQTGERCVSGICRKEDPQMRRVSNAAGLIDAINMANQTFADDIIILQPGIYDLTEVDNFAQGPNGLPGIGLPNIPSRITIAATTPGTIIQRATDEEFRIFHVAPTGTLVLNGVIVQNGLISSGFSEGGGGIRNLGTLELNNSEVRGNAVRLEGALVSGGGIENSGSGIARLFRSVVHNNTAGVGIDGGTVGQGFGHGGGIFSSGLGQLTLTESTVRGNTATINGGGIQNFGGTLTLLDSTVDRNRAGFGGGIFNDSRSGNAVATLTRSTVSRNVSSFFGGPAGGSGGITNLLTATLTLRNSTISGNVGRPGGIHNQGAAELTLNNVTITDNTATADAIPDAAPPVSGVLNEGTATVSNTIIAQNDNNTDCEGTFMSLGFNLIGSAPQNICRGFGASEAGAPGQPKNAGLGPLARHPDEAFTETHLLLPGFPPNINPAVDAGNPDPVRNPEETLRGQRGNACEGVDQRGVNRPQNGNEVGTATCDIGAVEIRPGGG